MYLWYTYEEWFCWYFYRMRFSSAKALSICLSLWHQDAKSVTKHVTKMQSLLQNMYQLWHLPAQMMIYTHCQNFQHAFAVRMTFSWTINCVTMASNCLLWWPNGMTHICQQMNCKLLSSSFKYTMCVHRLIPFNHFSDIRRLLITKYQRNFPPFVILANIASVILISSVHVNISSTFRTA